MHKGSRQLVSNTDTQQRGCHTTWAARLSHHSTTPKATHVQIVAHGVVNPAFSKQSMAHFVLMSAAMAHSFPTFVMSLIAM